MIELTPEQRAERAKQILNEPVFQQAFASMEINIYTGLKSVGVGDSDGQRDLIVTLQLLDDFKRRFEHHVQTGEMIEMANTKPQRKI